MADRSLWSGYRRPDGSGIAVTRTVVGPSPAHGCSLTESPMPTIVEYTDKKSALNHYPLRIISPPNSSQCCFSGMEEIGSAERADHWVYRYKCCRTCGFTVRVALSEIPNEALLADVRNTLSRAFQRRPRDY
jgi:hypothetical protein